MMVEVIVRCITYFLERLPVSAVWSFYCPRL